MGKDLKKMVAMFNELSNAIKTFDVDLRAEDALNLPKARKTQLPPDAVGAAGAGCVSMSTWRGSEEPSASCPRSVRASGLSTC